MTFHGVLIHGALHASSSLSQPLALLGQHLLHPFQRCGIARRRAVLHAIRAFDDDLSKND